MFVCAHAHPFIPILNTLYAWPFLSVYLRYKHVKFIIMEAHVHYVPVSTHNEIPRADGILMMYSKAHTVKS